MTKYTVVTPDGHKKTVAGRGEWFVAWRLSRRCQKAWALKGPNTWLVEGGWIRKRSAQKRMRLLSTCNGWSEGSVADARLPPGSRLMCGARNVKIIRGEVVE